MAKGGGNTTSTVYQSNLPEYAEPYYTNLMSTAQGEANRPYIGYGGQRNAGMSDQTSQGLTMASNFASSGLGDLDQARDLTGIVGERALGYGDYDETQYAFQGFGQDQADAYMSPYMQSVVDVAKRNAADEARMEAAMRGADQAKAGAFGGSRAAVQSQIANNATLNRLSDIQVEGSQHAFENAQGQFNTDRAQMFATQQAQESANQFGANIGMQGLELAGNTAGQLAAMEAQRDQMNLQRIQAKLGIGQTQEDYRQQELDTAYDDFINQRDAGRQNLQFMSSLLQGVPVSANQNVTQTTPSNNLAGAAGTVTGLQALYQLGRGT